MLSRIWNVVGFQAAWFACVLGAAHDHPWLGPFAVLLLLTGHIATMPEWQQPLRRIIFIGVFGMFVDSMLGLAGVLQYRDGLGAGWICPPWLVALWMAFATTLKPSLGWLEKRYATAALVGGIFGPLSYYSGHAAGALRVRGDLVDGLLVLAVLWATLLPGLLWIGAAPNLKLKIDRD
ncbi:MAG: hypothetical protein JW388_0929 [Nitrospira sp.]|nr:hypothetical protein [Nitrospira sp.]